MKSYKNFEIAISYFDLDLMLSYEDSLGAMEICMNAGYIKKQELLVEVEEAFANPYFDWVEFVVRNNVLYESEEKPLTKEYAKEYIKSLVWNYLFGDNETKSVVS